MWWRPRSTSSQPYGQAPAGPVTRPSRPPGRPSATRSGRLILAVIPEHHDLGSGLLGSPGLLGNLALEWKIHGDSRPGPGGAVQPDRAAQSLDPVGQSGQPGPARG